jgi:hypothetical protein
MRNDFDAVTLKCLCSLMAKQLFCKQQIVGSSPTSGSSFMTYERFSELWDLFVGDFQKNKEITPTLQALIDYANGDKRQLEAIRIELNNGRE